MIRSSCVGRILFAKSSTTKLSHFTRNSSLGWIQPDLLRFFLNFQTGIHCEKLSLLLSKCYGLLKASEVACSTNRTRASCRSESPCSRSNLPREECLGCGTKNRNLNECKLNCANEQGRSLQVREHSEALVTRN